MNNSFVPASYAKKQARNKTEQAELVKNRAEKRSLVKKRREEWTERARRYHQRAIDTQRRLVDSFRQARKEGNFYMPPEAKVIFAIRLKGYLLIFIYQ